MIKECETAARRLADYLASNIHLGRFPWDSYYGEALSLWLFADIGIHNDKQEELLDKVISELNDAESKFSFEFINLGLYKYFEITGDYRIKPYLQYPRYLGTKVCNWGLLRLLDKIMEAKINNKILSFKHFLTRSKCLLLLKIMQMDYGLIKDDPFLFDMFPLQRATKSRSLQYHAFSLFLLYHIWKETGWSFVKNAFCRGAEFASNFVLSNGDSAYIGRGLEQVKGYACLLFSLTAACCLDVQNCMKAAEKVFSYLISFQRKDGSFPLVLNGKEMRTPEKADVRDSSITGWYSYNTVADYLPLVGVCLFETAKLLAEKKLEAELPEGEEVNLKMFGEDFAIWRNNKYEAVLSKPGGDWTNDLPIPYLCVKNNSLLPCYGGEEYHGSFYSKEMIPLPYYINSAGTIVFIRDLVRYRLCKKSQNAVTILGQGFGAEHLRDIIFLDSCIEINDSVKLEKPLSVTLETIYPFVIFGFSAKILKGNRILLSNENESVEVEIDGIEGKLEVFDAYCARGKLVGIREVVKASDIFKWKRHYKLLLT
ncbi:MAG: hypothetical protein ABIH42_08735 [Planctomycetota bacterium]